MSDETTRRRRPSSAGPRQGPRRTETRAEEQGAAYGQSRMERRRDRRGGRNLVEGWVLILAAVAIVAAGVLVARAVGGAIVHRAAPQGTAKAEAAPASSARSKEASPAVTAVYATMRGSGVKMHFPAIASDMVAIGFHQAWNKKATDMKPALKVHPKDAYADTKAALKKDASLKLFEMMSRGRGSSEYSAADCAVKPGAIILSPVTGVVTLITTYKLAGVGTDYRIEIKADGASSVRVVMIHLKDVTVKAGERVEGGLTPLATVRHLPIDNQVNRYLPVAADHTHVQINAVGYKLNEES